MFSLWVTLEITPEGREEFLEAIAINARASVRDEEGCYRFDVIELGAGSTGTLSTRYTGTRRHLNSSTRKRCTTSRTGTSRRALWFRAVR